MIWLGWLLLGRENGCGCGVDGVAVAGVSGVAMKMEISMKRRKRAREKISGDKVKIYPILQIKQTITNKIKILQIPINELKLPMRLLIN